MELKPIPGTLGFLADSEGNIYDPEGNKRNTYRNGDGYVTASVLTDVDGWVTFGAHRLVARAFHGVPEGEADQINHRDMNILNNRVDNLEWVTVEQNNIHAEIMRRDNHRPCIYANHRESGVHQLYLNAWFAADHSGVEPLDIWDAIKTGEDIDGWRFFYQKYSGNIPKEVQKERIKPRDEGGTIPERAVKIRLIDSPIKDGTDAFTFSSIAAAARFFNVGTSAIHQAIPQHDVVRVFQKKYQIAYIDQDFQILTDEDIERAKNTGPKDVVAYNHVEDKFWFFDSAVAYLEHSKLSKKAVTTALAKNRFRKIGDWTALYYEGENFRTLIEHVKGSSPGVIVSKF